MSVGRSPQVVEIQGLRGIAVLSVVLDHALGYPTGGFLGVDVFFVIFGFVIMRQLLSERRTSGRIDLLAFARRRVRRLAPAAVVTVLVTFTLASLLAGNGQRRDIQLDALASLLGVANWRFALQQVDYFGRESTPSPFRHFWSLGVEEQFYVFLPLVVVAVLASGRSTARRPVLCCILAGGAIASVVWSAIATSTSTTAAYFDTGARAWELLVGVLLALAVDRGLRDRPTLREVGVVLGAALVVATVVLGREDQGVPVPLAIPAVIGCALVIAAVATGRSRAAAALRAVPLVRLGDASYSVYLWHWPVIVLLPQIVPTPPLVLAVAGVAVGVASNLLIERRSRPAFRMGLVFLLLATDVVSVTSAIDRVRPTSEVVQALDDSVDSETTSRPADAVRNDRRRALAQGLTARSWPSDLSPSFDEVAAPGYQERLIAGDGWGGSLHCGDRGEQWTGSACQWGPEDGAEVLVVGDSTGVFTMPGWRAAALASDSRLRVRAAARYGCPFIDLRLPSAPTACDGHNERVEEHLRSKRYDVVVITNRFWVSSDTDMKDVSEQEYGDALERQIAKIRDRVGTVVVAPPPPPGPPLATCKSSGHPVDCASKLENVDRQLRRVRSAADNRVIEENDLWCLAGVCPALSEGQLSRIDVTHASPTFSEAAGPALARALGALGVPDSGSPSSGDVSEPGPGSEPGGAPADTR